MKITLKPYKKCDGPVERVFLGSLMSLAAVIGLWYSMILLLAIF